MNKNRIQVDPVQANITKSRNLATAGAFGDAARCAYTAYELLSRRGDTIGASGELDRARALYRLEADKKESDAYVLLGQNDVRGAALAFAEAGEAAKRAENRSLEMRMFRKAAQNYQIVGKTSEYHFQKAMDYLSASEYFVKSNDSVAAIITFKAANDNHSLSIVAKEGEGDKFRASMINFTRVRLSVHPLTRAAEKEAMRRDRYV